MSQCQMHGDCKKVNNSIPKPSCYFLQKKHIAVTKLTRPRPYGKFQRKISTLLYSHLFFEPYSFWDLLLNFTLPHYGNVVLLV